MSCARGKLIMCRTPKKRINDECLYLTRTASRLGGSIFYTEAVKIKIMPFSKLFTDLLRACIRSVCISDVLIPAGAYAHLLQSHLRREFLTKLGRSELRAWCTAALTVTRSTHLVLVSPGTARTKADIHHPRILHVLIRIILKRAQVVVLPKPILLYRKMWGWHYLNELLQGEAGRGFMAHEAFHSNCPLSMPLSVPVGLLCSRCKVATSLVLPNDSVCVGRHHSLAYFCKTKHCYTMVYGSIHTGICTFNRLAEALSHCTCYNRNNSVLCFN